MNSIYSETDPVSVLKQWLMSQPQRGRGQLKKIADLLSIPSPVLSQIISGQRTFSEDQAFLLCDYFGLAELESEYFLCLIQIERAHHHAYKSHLKTRAEAIRKKANTLETRLRHEKTLSEKDQAEFYSSWVYSAVRLFCGLNGGATIEQVCREFSLERPRAIAILQFLSEAGLIEESKSGYVMGPSRTHVGKDSPFVSRHHANWRIRATERAQNLRDRELMFSGPMSLAKKDFDELRQKMVSWIEEVSQKVKDSPPEILACFNIDFFEMK